MKGLKELNKRIKNEVSPGITEGCQKADIVRKIVLEECDKNEKFPTYLKACKIQRETSKLVDRFFSFSAVIIAIFSFSLTIMKDIGAGFKLYLWTSVWGTVAALIILVTFGCIFLSNKAYSYDSYIFAVAEELEKEEVKKDETYN